MMKPNFIYLLLLLVIAALSAANVYLLNEVRQSHQQIRRAQEEMEIGAGLMKAEVNKMVLEVKESAGLVFNDMIENMRLFSRLSQEEDKRIRELVRARKDRVDQVTTEPDLTADRALRIIDLDDEIIAAFNDYAELQAMHRKRLMEKLTPLAQDLGFEEVSSIQHQD